MNDVKFNKLWGVMFKKSLLPMFLVFLIAVFYIWIYQIYLKETLSENQKKLIEGALYFLTTVFVIYWVQKLVGAGLGWYRDTIAIKTRTSLVW